MNADTRRLKIKKGHTVQVITGSDKGKKGTVLDVNGTKLLARVQGIRVQTHYDKKEGLLKKEGYIHYSNLKLVDAPAPAVKKAKTKAKSKSSPKKA